MSDPLFLAPLRTEALAVHRGAKGAEIVRIGMGPVRATAARARLSRLEAGRPLVLLGFAGGLDTALRAGDLVVASSCASIGDEETVLLPEAPSAAHLLALAGLPVAVHLGPIASAERVLKGREARVAAAAHGALAVDMESRWCAPLAARHPLAIVRAVVDVLDHEVLSFKTPAATWKAFRSLSAAASALRGWSPVSLDNDCKVGDR